MNNKLSVRDYFWVFLALVRGRLLRQKSYQPKPWGTNSSIMFGMKGMTFRRLSLLMKCWGLQPMTLTELNACRNFPPQMHMFVEDAHLDHIVREIALFKRRACGFDPNTPKPTNERYAEMCKEEELMTLRHINELAKYLAPYHERKYGFNWSAEPTMDWCRWFIAGDVRRLHQMQEQIASDVRLLSEMQEQRLKNKSQ